MPCYVKWPNGGVGGTKTVLYLPEELTSGEEDYAEDGTKAGVGSAFTPGETHGYVEEEKGCETVHEYLVLVVYDVAGRCEEVQGDDEDTEKPNRRRGLEPGVHGGPG